MKYCPYCQQMVEPVGPRRGCLSYLFLIILCSITIIGWIAWFIVWLLGLERVYCPMCGCKTVNDMPTQQTNTENANQMPGINRLPSVNQLPSGKWHGSWLYTIILVIIILAIIGGFISDHFSSSKTPATPTVSQITTQQPATSDNNQPQNVTSQQAPAAPQQNTTPVPSTTSTTVTAAPPQFDTVPAELKNISPPLISDEETYLNTLISDQDKEIQNITVFLKLFKEGESDPSLYTNQNFMSSLLTYGTALYAANDDVQDTASPSDRFNQVNNDFLLEFNDIGLGSSYLGTYTYQFNPNYLNPDLKQKGRDELEAGLNYMLQCKSDLDNLSQAK
jgi:hypothetical protein